MLGGIVLSELVLHGGVVFDVGWLVDSTLEGAS